MNNFSATFGGGVDVFSASGIVTLTNNTITMNSANTDNGGGLKITLVDSTTEIYNNIVWNNTAGFNGDDIFISISGGNTNPFNPTVLRNNDYSDLFIECGNSVCVPLQLIQNINRNPRFVDAANGDVHLKARSPVIDAGTSSAPALPAKDFEGDPRIGGMAPDMGADEFTGVMK